MSMIDDERVCEAFVTAIIQMSTSAPIVQAITKNLILYEKIMMPVEKFSVTLVNEEVSKVAPLSVVIALPSPLQSHGDLSSSKDK